MFNWGKKKKKVVALQHVFQCMDSRHTFDERHRPGQRKEDRHKERERETDKREREREHCCMINKAVQHTEKLTHFLCDNSGPASDGCSSTPTRQSSGWHWHIRLCTHTVTRTNKQPYKHRMHLALKSGTVHEPLVKIHSTVTCIVQIE